MIKVVDNKFSTVSVFRSQYTEIENLDNLYDDLMNLIVQLGNAGVIHGDFNEFNIMLKNDGKPVLIDFPQMVSTSHADAKKYLLDFNYVKVILSNIEFFGF